MSLLEGLLKPLKGIFNLLNSPLATIIILMIGIIAVAGIYVWMQVKPQRKVLYFSPEEHRGIEFTVKRTTPAHLYTKKKGGDIYRFIRFRDAFNFQVGFKSITRWLGTKGTAYTKKLESGEVGEFTLWNIMQAVWGQDVCDSLIDEQKQKLIESEVNITVRLEEGLTPKEHKDISELYIKKEADDEMARVFGENIRRELTREDWIRTEAIFIAGVGACYMAQAMGILGGVAT